jgi:hypothetical protein
MGTRSMLDRGRVVLRGCILEEAREVGVSGLPGLPLLIREGEVNTQERVSGEGGCWQPRGMLWAGGGRACQ